MKDERSQLISLLSLYSISKGKEFTLSSGTKSNVYIDVKKTILSGSIQKILPNLLLEKFYHFTPATAVAGVVLGGCHLASMVATYAAIKYDIGLDVIYVRKSPKEHGTMQLLERPSMTQDQEVVLFEDVITTGNSACVAAKAIEDAGFIVNGIIAVIDRRENKDPYIGETFRNWKVNCLINFDELEV